MVNFESDTAYFYWTFDRLGDLEQGQAQYGFDRLVWKCEMIQSYTVGESQLTFCSPTTWAGLPPLTFCRTPQGHYEHRSEGVVYNAVRADTKTHVVLTGRWSEMELGKGTFIAVLPIKEDSPVLIQTAIDVPVESRVPVTMARDSSEV
jgi:hypothetical protein